MPRDIEDKRGASSLDRLTERVLARVAIALLVDNPGNVVVERERT